MVTFVLDVAVQHIQYGLDLVDSGVCQPYSIGHEMVVMYLEVNIQSYCIEHSPQLHNTQVLFTMSVTCHFIL